MKTQKTLKQLIKKLILKRKPASSKNDYGHVLVIAGSRGMTGAAALCANACIRSGAGLVTLGVPCSQQPVAAKKTLPEAMTLSLAETKNAALSAKALKKILGFIYKRKITGIAMGPGLSTNPSTKKLVLEILKKCTVPVVLDADALNAIPGSLNVLKKSAAGITVTPHPGELSRLSQTSVSSIQKTRLHSAVDFARANNVICVLKGHKTIVTDGKKTFINTTGNPGMSKGGSGDVLTGMIAAFRAQVKGSSMKEKLLNAAVASVYLHGLAGDLAAKEKTQISMTPGDIIDYIPEAVKKTLK
ncbi:MAG: NAD(P)H-hydrate dehydratase [Elusimicrobia bacterium RIFOXYB2_FULL_48_7]|nr:MAG: NAD(P)H-hydrate dehydratase [Elusimicrobia bacterium RIFOXYB2_FULL_48_7]